MTNLRAIADDLADDYVRLEREKAAAKTRKERKAINQRMHLVLELLRWALSQRGYS